MDALLFVAGGLVGLFVVYLLARLISAAWYRSKADYERSNKK